LLKKVEEQKEIYNQELKNENTAKESMRQIEINNKKKKEKLKLDELERIAKKKKEEEENSKKSRTFKGDGKGNDATVNFQTEVYGSGKIDVNLRLIYYSNSTKKFRIELEYKDANNDYIHSWTSPNIELTKLEDTSLDYSFMTSVNKANKIKSVNMNFRWANAR